MPVSTTVVTTTPKVDQVQARAASRVASVDFVRGVAMVLMAIDHVRVYSGLPAGGPTFGIFFTRWITHLVAPTFVFLAGTAAYLHGRKLNNKTALSKFLVSRGLWLVFMELTILRLAWTFNLDFAHYMLAGVIWMLGWCMVLMAALAWLSLKFNAIAGVAIIAIHNLTNVFQEPIERYYANSEPNWFLKLLYFGSGSAVHLGKNGPPLVVLYVIIPWIGLMMAGYAFGKIVEWPMEERRRFCLKLGVSLTLLFVLLRALDIYGDPRAWHVKPGADAQASAQPKVTPRPPLPVLMRFLNTTKYPASLDFMLMTIGPMFLLLSFAEHLRGRAAGIITTLGRVPMFYYLLHIPLIHAAACVVSLLRDGRLDHWLLENHPMGQSFPPPHVWSLGQLYLVYFICLFALYFPCKWYAGVRAHSRSHWLSYV
jgi:uncharacterized membrane protein